jgi:hypothetical protein
MALLDFLVLNEVKSPSSGARIPSSSVRLEVRENQVFLLSIT